MDFSDYKPHYLIKTKYKKPDITSHLIPRRHLTEKLNRALTRKVLFVSAPAGYGKSTAVLEWLNSGSLHSAWVSLDNRDNDAHFFWMYVCHALNDIDATIVSDTGYVFSSHELFEANMHLSILLDKLSAAISDVFLVLDDFHTITDPRIFEDIAYFVDYFPPNMHLIIISRSEPDMRLVHLEMEGQLARITTEDLRFRHTEIRQFYEKRGLNLDKTEIESIESYSEGWVASLVAVAISMDDERWGERLRKGISVGNASLHQYLLNEVYSTWAEEKKAFFMQTSILDSFCGSLCDAMTGHEGNGDLLETLNKGNSFLIPLDGTNGWYRYHHIFRDFLNRRLMESGSNSLSELYKKAACWYQENGYLFQAIEHYLAGEYYKEALDLIEGQCFFILDTGDFRSVLSWIKRLPEVYAENSLEINAIQAGYYAHIGSYEMSRHRISRMETIAALKGSVSGAAEILAKTECQLVRGYCLSLEGDMIGLSSILRSARENTGLQYTLKNDFVDLNPCDIYFYRCPANNFIGLYGNHPGVFQEIVSNYQVFVTTSPGYDSLIAGEYLYEKDRLDESVSFLLTAMEKADGVGCLGVLVPSMVTMARINMARGDIRGALAAIEECEVRLHSTNRRHWNYLLKAFKARLYLSSGDFQAGHSWFETCKLGIYHEITRTREFELIVYARFLIAQGSMNEADILLKRLLAFATNMNRRHSAVEILNLLSIASFRNAETEKAMDYLGKSITIGMDEEYLRSFFDEREPIDTLLGHFTAKGKKQRAYVQTLTKHIAKGIPLTEAQDRGTHLTALKQLTRQEYKVLQLLADGYTNQQISKQLSISLSTTKAHILSIFGKLQVTTRIQCTNKARRLGLIP